MSVSERVELLLNQMTLEEKAAQTDMIRGVTMATRVHPAHFCAVDETSDFYWDRVRRMIGSRGIGFVHDVYSVPAVLNRLQRYFIEKTRLGIPCIFTGEALHGINFPGATSFPMPVSLGASFDPALTEQIGRAIGAEARALGIHEILAPNLDVARDPRWGRVEETFGEDTYLSSRMAEAIISGEQGNDISQDDHVVCEPKHYLAHGFPESGLNCSPARAGSREIRSEYLPVFAAGIQESGAYNAMAAYHSIDGTPLICSRYYLTDVLKGELGLKGYIRADFGAVNRLRNEHHLTDNDLDSIALALNAGLDVTGFDFSNEVWQSGVVQLVRSGRIPMERINDAVRRILRVKFELGLFDHPYADEKKYRRIVRSEAHRELCLNAARESMVLLKNDGVLPLRKAPASIALLGPSSHCQRLGSYASTPYGYQVPSVYEELQKALPNTIILQEDGCGISPRDYRLIPAKWLPGGVRLDYYETSDFTAEPVGSDRFQEIRFNWGLAKPHPSLNFHGYGVVMTGTLQPDASFNGMLLVPCQDSVRLYIDGRLLLDGWSDHRQDHAGVDFSFHAGESHAFRIEYTCDHSGRNVTFAYSNHDEHGIDRAVTLAEQSDLVILVCGDDTVTSGEGMDRSSLRLYGPQKELIRRIGALKKPTVLVLEVGKPVDLTEEEPDMNAILLPWFGGEMGARAIVEALLGLFNPAGRLPISFPKNVGCLPCYYTQLPGGSPAWLEDSKESRYPFGFGLSYTDFTLDTLTVEVTGSCTAEARFIARNTGDTDGVCVPQLYVEDPVSTVVTPDKRLCAFDRVALKAGESRECCFSLDERAFRLLNAQHCWVVEPGRFILHLGLNSRDMSQQVEIQLKGNTYV